MKRWFLALTAWLLCLTLHAQSPQYQFQYWFDGDYVTHSTDSNAIGVWRTQMEISHLSVGFHTLYLHIRDTSGQWSSPMSYLFYHAGDTVSSSAFSHICWFDHDYSSRISDTGSNMLIDVSTLSDGFHTLNLQTGVGRGAALQSFLFYKTPATDSTISGQSYVVWFDHDYSSRISGTGSNMLIDVSTLSDGFHTLNLQTGVGRGAALQSFLFYKTPATESTISGQSYVVWFDLDYSSRISGTGNDMLIDVSTLSDGFHTLNLQTGVGRGAALQSFLFYKTPAIESTISGQSYVVWFDLDYSSRISGTGNNMLIDVSTLSDGFHTLNLQTGVGRGAALQSFLFYKAPDMGIINDSTVLTWNYSIDGREYPPIEVSPTNGLIHLDLNVASLMPGLHSLSYYMTASSGTISVAKTTYFHVSGTGIVKYEYWFNKHDSIKTVVNTTPTDTLQIVTLLDVPPFPIRSTCFHFDPNDGVPLIKAKNEINFRFWTGDSRFIDRTSYYVDDYVNDTIVADTLERDTSKVIQIPNNNQIHWFKLAAGVGDSLSFHTDRPCTMQLFAPSGEEVFSAKGNDVLNWDGCHAWENGVYYLAVHDAEGIGNIAVSYQWIYRYAVQAHTPSVVGSAPSMVTVHLLGNGFDNLSNISFFNADTLWNMDSIISSDNTEAYVDFFMTGSMPLGHYKLMLEFTDVLNVTDTIIVNNAIQIVPAEYGNIDIWYDYVSSFTSPHIINVHITNTGNVPYLGVPIVFANTRPDVSTVLFPDRYIYFDSLDVFDSISHNAINLFNMGVHARYTPFIINRIGPYQTFSMQLEFDCPRGGFFDFYAWAGKLWSIIDTTDNSEQMNPAMSHFHSQSKASNTGRDLCDMPDPCDAAEVFGEAVECLCGESMGIIETLAGSVLAPVLKGRREKEAWAAEQGYGGNVYAEHPPLQTPSSILRQAMEHCTPDVAQGVADVVYALWDELDGEDCPDPPPIRPSIPSPPVDPNEITGYTATSGSKAVHEYFENMPYVIEYENDSLVALGMAHVVIVRDTLDGNVFDLNSFSASSFAIGDEVTTINGGRSFARTVDMRPEINVLVQAQLDYHIDTSYAVATWTFSSIDPMTLQPTVADTLGFLAIGGTGEVNFTINRKGDLPDSTIIDNRAWITFDNEEPIVTTTWRNIIDVTAPESIIDSVVYAGDTAVVSIVATDNLSGIWRYSIYAQLDNDEMFPVAMNIAADSLASFVPPAGTVMLYSSAVDSAGNIEPVVPTRPIYYDSLYFTVCDVSNGLTAHILLAANMCRL